MFRSTDQVMKDVTINYINDLMAKQGPPPQVSQITTELLDAMTLEYNLENVLRSKEQRLKLPKELKVPQIATIIKHCFPVCKIPCAGDQASEDYDIPALYQETGPDAGLYVTSERAFFLLAKEFNHNLSKKDFQEIMFRLSYDLPRKFLCNRPNLIAVNNGIFDYDTKQLMPFSPDYVFLSKSKVDYNPTATNPIIHNSNDNTDWDVETWLADLSDDPEIVHLLWEILGAIIRPFVPWDKSAWFYSTTGNNGKGTLCELMRQLCGPGTYASIPISEFGKDFALEPLLQASAIIVDENDVGTYIEKVGNLKAIITNDVIQINRKFKSALSFKFHGFMVQCLNEFPRIKDKSDSFSRRQLFIPFSKCFTGQERKYIKADYLHRKDVLEYVLYRVLNMNYYKLSEPDACKEVLQEYKAFNDNILEFMNDIMDRLQWDIVPIQYLYDLYLAWLKENSPSSTPQGKITFTKDFVERLGQYPDWTYRDRKNRKRVTHLMNKPEPLTIQYNLTKWMNPYYSGNDNAKRAIPNRQPSELIQGILRRGSVITAKITPK